MTITHMLNVQLDGRPPRRHLPPLLPEHTTSGQKRRSDPSRRVALAVGSCEVNRRLPVAIEGRLHRCCGNVARRIARAGPMSVITRREIEKPDARLEFSRHGAVAAGIGPNHGTVNRLRRSSRSRRSESAAPRFSTAATSADAVWGSRQNVGQEAVRNSRSSATSSMRNGHALLWQRRTIGDQVLRQRLLRGRDDA